MSKQKQKDGNLLKAGATGTVKWFQRVKGHGFIHLINGYDGREAFVHYSAIDGEGYRNLFENDSVKFDLFDTKKGLQARNVRVSSGGPVPQTPPTRSKAKKQQPKRKQQPKQQTKKAFVVPWFSEWGMPAKVVKLLLEHNYTPSDIFGMSDAELEEVRKAVSGIGKKALVAIKAAVQQLRAEVQNG